MGEVIRFISKAERERLRLIREAARTTTVFSRRPIRSRRGVMKHQPSIRSTEPGFIRAPIFWVTNNPAVPGRRTTGEIAMSIRSMFFAAAFGIASTAAAHADGLRPMAGKSIDLGGISGIAYYTVQRDGFHVVATLAEGEAGTPSVSYPFLHLVSALFSQHRNKPARLRSAGKATAYWFARRTRSRTDLIEQCAR